MGLCGDSFLLIEVTDKDSIISHIPKYLSLLTLCLQKLVQYIVLY